MIGGEDGDAAAAVSYDTEGLHYKHNGRQESIARDTIIAVVRSDEESSVLYASSNDHADQDSKASPAVFKSLLIGEVPEELDADFPSGPPLLASRDHVAVFVSAGSGTGLANDVWQRLIQPVFEWYGWKLHKDYDHYVTTSETTISELTHGLVLRRANEGRRQTIVLLSGDGGMVDVTNALIAASRSEDYKKPEIALLPFGTGNALANSSGITGDSTFGLRVLLQGQPKDVPVFRATFSPGARLLTNEGREERELEGSVDQSPVAHGAVVCSWGLHATLVADSDTTEYRKFGAERFKMAGKEALFPSDGSLPHGYQGKVSVLKPGESGWQALERTEHGYILATLVSHLEAGFQISPSSRALDGKLRLVHFGRLSGDEAMGIMTKAYQGGQHVDDEKVGYEVIEGLKIEFAEEDARWRRVCVDGKIIRVEKGGFVEVRMGVEGVLDLLTK